MMQTRKACIKVSLQAILIVVQTSKVDVCKGHRSSLCSHRDRPLLPIRRKGRPISQCDRCREQRLKYSVHQKCVCRQSNNNKPPQVHETGIVLVALVLLPPPSFFNFSNLNNNTQKKVLVIDSSSHKLREPQQIMAIESLLV